MGQSVVNVSRESFVLYPLHLHSKIAGHYYKHQFPSVEHYTVVDRWIGGGTSDSVTEHI